MGVRMSHLQILLISVILYSRMLKRQTLITSDLKLDENMGQGQKNVWSELAFEKSWLIAQIMQSQKPKISV